MRAVNECWGTMVYNIYWGTMVGETGIGKNAAKPGKRACATTG